MTSPPPLELPVDAVLREALAERSPVLLGEALRSAGFLLGLTDDVEPPRPLVAVDGSGTRALPVFSGPDAAAAWGGVHRAGLVDGQELIRLARQQQVDVVLFDPAGPVPAELPLDELTLLADGLVPGRGSPHEVATAFQVRAAASPPAGLQALLRQVAAERGLVLWLFERRAAATPVLTVGVEGTADDAAAVAARLGAWGADQRRPAPDLDVVLLTGQTRDAVAAQVPMARLTGSR